MDNKKILTSSLNDINLSFTEADINKIEKYIDVLLEYNKQSNLVGTKLKQDILIRHIIDSLSIFKYSNYFFEPLEGKDFRILDIGTGAGLPGILISIFLKDSHVYLLDKRSKAIKFLKEIVHELNLENVYIIEGNAEYLGHDVHYRENFDVVLSRAVGKFNIICELMLPFCKIGGKAVLYKSRKLHDEIEQYKKMIPILGGKVDKILDVKVPNLDEYRAFLSILKETSTLYKYPRKYAKILKKPLAE
ncbi:MAG: 16S rRNA (guanine(527)-N(7))-methyltransferase RsmG [Actinobacteria bacterium]|nr:16S rRNA (guanine(527)-N(7))-methyltransferase RsmG [Actinomycetota bacterium]